MTKSSRDDRDGPTSDGAPRGLGIRHVQVAVMSAATFMAYSLNSTLSVAIVAMVENRPINDTNATASNANGTNATVSPTPAPLAPTYNWDEETQGFILSSFLWGYILTQIPAGILTDRYGGHRFLCAAILGSSLLCLVLPQCVYYGGWMLVCANRSLQGISQGFVFPAVFTLLGVWVPPAERSVLASLATGAQLLGTVASTPLSGFLCSAYGWPTVFYTLGGFGTVVSIVMIFLGADSPSTHRMISYRERDYICGSLGGAKVRLNVPWKLLLSSIPFWAATIAMAFESWVFLTFLTKIPTYLGTVLKFSMTENGLYSGLPFLVSWLLTFAFSWLCNVFIDRGWLGLSATRKVFNTIAHFGGGAFTVLMALSHNKFLSVALLTAFMGTQAGVFVGVQAGFVDLAPNFSGAIFSVANFVSIGACISGPIIVGYIVTESGSAEQWAIVFYLSAIILVVSNIVYLIWGTSETQWWNWPDRYRSKQDFVEKQNKDDIQEADPARLRSLLVVMGSRTLM